MHVFPTSIFDFLNNFILTGNTRLKVEKEEAYKNQFSESFNNEKDTFASSKEKQHIEKSLKDFTFLPELGMKSQNRLIVGKLNARSVSE